MTVSFTPAGRTRFCRDFFNVCICVKSSVFASFLGLRYFLLFVIFFCVVNVAELAEEH